MEFALFVCPHSGYRFYSKMVAKFGIESMREMWDPENNHIEITGLRENLSRDDTGIEQPY